MKAVIMAGGEGTRLRPLTCNKPKPMVPIVNKPVMEHTVELLKQNGINEIAVTLQYMPDAIRNYFEDGEKFGVKMHYYVETVPLGTAGSVRNAEEFLTDTFVVISGDALTDADLTRIIEFHHSKKSVATIVLKKVNAPVEYGVVIIDDLGKILQFQEKPGWGEVFSDTVNTGIYILSSEVFKYYKKGEVFDFSKDLFPILLKDGKSMFGYVMEDYWCDIGDLKAYIKSHNDVLDGKVKVNIPGKQIRDGVWVGEGTLIEAGAVVNSPAIIGDNCKIRKDAVIDSYSVVGDLSFVGGGSVIKRSILWRNTYLSKNTQLRGSVICDKAVLRRDVSVFEQSVVGHDVTVGENSVIKPNVKIWPSKIIDEGSEVAGNIVWGSKFNRSIFGCRGIGGEVNVDITPEYMCRIGAAYGSVFKSDSIIGISSDGLNSSNMLKNSIASGILSSGLSVCDFGTIVLPGTRSAVTSYRVDGALHISGSKDDSLKIFVDFLDKDGSNIGREIERKIENAVFRDDFRRCSGDSVKSVVPLFGFNECYLNGISGSVKSKKLDYRILLNNSTELVFDTMNDLLTRFGCEVRNVNSIDFKGFSQYVVDNNFDMGILMNDNCEKMIMADDRGRIITEDMFTAITSLILLQTVKGGTVVVPVSASKIFEDIARDNGGSVIRCKTHRQEIMSKILNSGTREEGRKQFLMNFDAFASLAKILDFMKLNNYKLSALADMIPDFHMRKSEVLCPWDLKGRVMRKLLKESSGYEVEILEGVKVYRDDGWVLILPDSEKAGCSVISEGMTQEFAEELCNIYVNKINEIIGNK